MEDIIEILSDPTKIKKISFKDSKVLFLKNFLLILVISLGSSLALYLLTSYLSERLSFDINNESKLIEQLTNISFVAILFAVSFVGPMLEELSFRLIVSTKKNIFVLGIIFLFSFLLLPLSSVNLAVLIILLSIMLLLVLFFANVKKEKLSIILERYLFLIVHLSSITFGLIHLVNYKNLDKLGILAPILVLPQIFLGYAFAYTRVKLGFFSAFLIHSIYNLIIVIGASFLDPTFQDIFK